MRSAHPCSTPAVGSGHGARSSLVTVVVSKFSWMNLCQDTLQTAGKLLLRKAVTGNTSMHPESRPAPQTGMNAGAGLPAPSSRACVLPQSSRVAQPSVSLPLPGVTTPKRSRSPRCRHADAPHQRDGLRDRRSHQQRMLRGKRHDKERDEAGQDPGRRVSRRPAADPPGEQPQEQGSAPQSP